MIGMPYFKTHFKPKKMPLKAQIKILPTPTKQKELPLILPKEAQAASPQPKPQNNEPASKISKTTQSALPKKSPPKQATWQESVRQQIAQQTQLFYPKEAIVNNWQGVAEVLIFLDEKGNVLTARLEESSGFALLDEAALKAAKALKSLPNGAPEEILLPIVFRLE